MDIFHIDQNNRKQIDDFIREHWFSMDMVVHGECIDLGTAEGLFACDESGIVGLITYRIVKNEMEILSLDSLHERTGIGTCLLDSVLKIAKDTGCSRVRLITTNDNLNALHFYQKRGFDIIRLYRNAVDESRKIKPQIPHTGSSGIPIRHELELEIRLEA